MNWRNRWVVLVPGEVAWVQRRTRELLEDEGDGDEHRFLVVPGQGRYQAIVQEGPENTQPQVLLGHALSLECEEPVYAIEGREEFPWTWRFLKGEQTDERQEPEDLVRSLGCVMPWADEPLLKPLERVNRTVVLIQGLSKARVLDALAREAAKELEEPLPADYYVLEEVPQGLMLRGATGELVFEDIALAQRFPRATLYSVVARPDLGFFAVSVRHKHETMKFSLPPREFPGLPVLHDIMGERTPERILAALGMSKEWFRL